MSISSSTPARAMADTVANGLTPRSMMALVVAAPSSPPRLKKP